MFLPFCGMWVCVRLMWNFSIIPRKRYLILIEVQKKKKKKTIEIVCVGESYNGVLADMVNNLFRYLKDTFTYCNSTKYFIFS